MNRDGAVYRSHSVIGGDYEVQGLQVTVATVFNIFRGYIILR
ncbi:hypothetical protein SH449x_002186 [Pirellulaceae bacterium SH449]